MAGSTALAIAPLGPPTAGLDQGQWRVAFEYGYREGDLEASNSKATTWGTIEIDDLDTGASATIKDVESSAYIANIGYGATENWEVYVLLGAADLQIDYENGTKFFDGTYDPYFGFGTKLTFRKEEPLSWGAMFQMDWTNSDDEEFFELDFFDDSHAEVGYYEIIIAVGPTYEMNEQFRIYGGPFFYLLDGEYELEVEDSIDFIDEYGYGKLSFDIEEESSFGGYIGAEYDLTENAPLFVELQFTPDSWGFGAGIGWKF